MFQTKNYYNRSNEKRKKMLKGEYLWVSPSFVSTAEHIVCGANVDACKFGDEMDKLLYGQLNLVVICLAVCNVSAISFPLKKLFANRK